MRGKKEATRKTRVEKPELHRHKEASKQPCRSCCSVSKHEEVAKQHSICRSRKEVAEHMFWIEDVVAVCILSQHYASGHYATRRIAATAEKLHAKEKITRQLRVLYS